MAEISHENDANLTARAHEEYDSEPRYVSKYREKIKKAAKRGKSAHKTFGVPTVNLNPPTEYLKKNSNVTRKRPEVHHKHYHRPGYQHKLPDWRPIRAGEKNDEILENRFVDFTKRNIDEAKNLRPLKARKYYVDDRHGTSHPLRTSGLYPVYRNRENYGKVPGRDFSGSGNRSKLKERNSTSPHPKDKITNKNREENLKNKKEYKSNVEKTRKYPEKSNEETFVKSRNDKTGRSEAKSTNGSEVAEVGSENSKLGTKSTKSDESNGKKKSNRSNGDKDDESIVSSRPEQPRCRYVDEDERAELLSGMKKKWDEMMKQFQRLPFLTDTPPKAKRKSQMEKDLQQLEKDIQVIERHPYIYVYSDDEENS